MLEKTLLNNMIDSYGSEMIFKDNQTRRLKGIFGKTTELIPALLPFRNNKKTQIAFYTKTSDIQAFSNTGKFIYAANVWQIKATRQVLSGGEDFFTQALLEKCEQSEVLYPIAFSFGGISTVLVPDKALIKQGALVVSVAAIDKFVTDETVGNEPIDVTIFGTISKTEMTSLAAEIKNGATKQPQTLTVDNFVNINAIIKSYSFNEISDSYMVDYEITFSQARSVS